MLALAALMITTFFVVSQQRGIVETERELASIELEVMANAVGSEFMQQVASKPFDSATIGINPKDATLSDLTASTSFGDSLNCPAACNDIDDFNAMQPTTLFFEVGRDEADVPFGFDFAITAEVRYVDAAGEETMNRTWVKKVTLFIDQVVGASGTKYLRAPIRLTQQFSLQ